MQGVMTNNGGRIRVEFSMPWYMRLTSLPFLAGGLYFIYYSGQILRQDLFGYGYWRDDWVGLAMCLAFATIVGLPGLVLLTLRYFVDLDRILQQVIVTKKFGPVKFESLRKLTEFKFLSITDDTNTDKDGDITSVFYDVNLCGGRGVRPIKLASFDKRGDATGFARDLGAALKLPGKDYVGTEPDEDA
ncbi:MAG: hypothetical protein U1E61_04205 [Bradyrhizobium sp.]